MPGALSNNIPRQTDLELCLAHRTANFEHGFHGGCERRFLVVEECFQERQHVIGGGAQRACTGKRRKVPVGDGREERVVTGSHALLPGGRERNTRVRHAKGPRDAGSDQALIIRSGAVREEVSEEPRAQVGVFDFGTGVAWQRVARKELIQIVHAIVGVGIAWVLQLQVAGEAWEAGAVGGKIEQRDGFAAPLRHLDIFGKISGRWIVEGDLFAAHHVRQYQRSEDLGDGSNFEDRITIERAWIAFGEVAIGDDAAAGRFDDARDNADRLLLSINAFYEDLADFVVARNLKWLEDIRIHKFKIDSTLCPNKRPKVI